MKVAIIGSRNLVVYELDKYIPDGCDDIVSGGAKRIDKCAEEYCYSRNLKLTIFCLNTAATGKEHPWFATVRLLNMLTKF